MEHDEKIALRHAIADIECPHKDAGSLAATVEHHWPTIKGELAKLEAEAAAMRTALRELSGQIIQGRVGFGLAVCPSLDPILAQTELALSTDAGRKVLDVVRAARVVDESAQGRGPQMGAKMQYHIITDDALTALRQALSALGWKP